MRALLQELGADTALVQYFVTEHRVVMLLTTADLQVARTTSIERPQLKLLIRQFHQALTDPGSDPKPLGQQLYRLLFSPIERDLTESRIKTVMLSLDGSLRYIPFGALYDGQQYLVENWRLPLFTELERDRLKFSPLPRARVAAFGMTRAVEGFRPLTGVQDELNQVVKTASGGLFPGDRFLDQQFNEGRLRSVTREPYQLLHIASHFAFSPGTEANSFLLLGDGSHLTLGKLRTGDWKFNNVDLLTLSACDTALGGGRDRDGREIEGFGDIVQERGARAVLASLWQISDASTPMLMTGLYRRLLNPAVTKAQALREAQLDLLHKDDGSTGMPRYSHPYFWAPFVLMGNWR